MGVRDQVIKKLFTGLEREWSSHVTMRDRAIEIIEALAAQLEAQGGFSEEYKRGFQDGVKQTADLTCKTDCVHYDASVFGCSLRVGDSCAREYVDLYDQNGNA